jgi:hypothetical protein
MSKSSSKALQRIIAKSSPEELLILISAVSTNICDYMMDIYGNYMCQTLFHTISAEQRLFLLNSLRPDLLKLAYHSRGTHALQNMISMMHLKDEESIYHEEFTGKLLEMSFNENASHIVQRLLVHSSNKFLISKEILGNVKSLSVDKLGVCVVKKCSNDPQIMHEILADVVSLMQHPYGNYAVQSILEQWKEEISFEFMTSIQGKVVQLCCQKYSSNVMEKAIKLENIRDSVAKELLNEYKMKEIASNQYGCYVLRSLGNEKRLECRGDLLEVFKQATSGQSNPKLKSLWKDIMKKLVE